MDCWQLLTWTRDGQGGWKKKFQGSLSKETGPVDGHKTGAVKPQNKGTKSEWTDSTNAEGHARFEFNSTFGQLVIKQNTAPVVTLQKEGGPKADSKFNKQTHFL